jgi:hypothetical protein
MRSLGYDGVRDLTAIRMEWTPPPAPHVVRVTAPQLELLCTIAAEAEQLLDELSISPEIALGLPVQPPPRVTADVDGRSVTIDGRPYPVEPDGAALVDALLRARGEWRNGEHLCKTVPLLEGARPWRVRKRLPADVQKLIEAKRASGHRLKPEYLSGPPIGSPS